MEDNKGTDKLNELIKDIKFCMMLTRHDNDLKGRPMATTSSKDGQLWFFTSSSTEKYTDINTDNNVWLSYSDPSSNTYVMVNGEAEISRDKNKISELWNPLLNAWFPEGANDPHLVLIKVKPLKAEYWDSSASGMIVLLNMVKAIVTGKTYDEGRHGKISL